MRASASIFHVNDSLADSGWRMNGLQRPPALHFCVTRPNTQPGVAELLETLGRPVVAASGADGPVEPLSERERIVLRYLSSMLSASEIAAELYVSVNTVKTHVRSIYRKLDTNRRRDAVRRAKELQLL